MVDSARNTNKITITLLDSAGVPTNQSWTFGTAATITIGRSDDSDIRLDCARISRVHAVVQFDGTDWQCTCEGKNGIFLNEAPVPAMTIDETVDLRFTSDGPILRFETEAGQTTTRGDVSQWLDDLQGRESNDAAAAIYNRYFRRIANLARGRLSSRVRRVMDEEDVAQAVLQNLFEGLSNGQYPDLKNREALWRLLSVMTTRKAINNVDKAHAQKRGGGQVRGESVFGTVDEVTRGLDRFEADTETPSWVVELAEEAERHLQRLASDALQETVRLKVAGYTNEEIAEKLGINTRTVERRLARIREVWASTGSA